MSFSLTTSTREHNTVKSTVFFNILSIHTGLEEFDLQVYGNDILIYLS
jgi:hypothetical protein